MTALAITHRTQQPAQQRAASAIEAMASRLQVDPGKLFQSLAATVFAGASNEEMLGLVVVANQYRLNPFLKQIYAFPKRGGGIVPIVGIDGWAAIVNSEENFDGCEFLYEDDDDGSPGSCTCIMHVKGRGHPIKVTEYFSECMRKTDPWTQMPRRMLRHKAFMQAGRLAFGLGGIYDEDEARDIATNVVAATGEGNSLVAGPARAADKGASIVDKLKKQHTAETGPATAEPAGDAGSNADVSPSAAASPAPSAAQVILTPSWDELAEHGITYIAEPEGIAVQIIAGDDVKTLRPDGAFDAKYSAWTVQPNTPEQDQLAREMAAKALTSNAATPPAGTEKSPGPRRPRTSPPKA